VSGGLLISALAVAARARASSNRPDLVQTSVTVVQHGAALHVKDAITNVGSVAAPLTRAAYYLGSRRIGSRRVRSLPPGRTSRGSKWLRLPPSVAPGSYRLRVCADRPARIREQSERNNCLAARTPIRVADGTPPVFAGVTEATFCVPGPIGNGKTSRYLLRWDRARDDVSAPGDIVYDVYEATAPRAEDFSTPTYSSRPGSTSFETPPLPTDGARYFVVRARDEAGNRDRNTVERQAVSICA
jgi:hypothetical protein